MELREGGVVVVEGRQEQDVLPPDLRVIKGSGFSVQGSGFRVRGLG